MISRKNLLVLAGAGVVILGVASTNAFADTATGPTSSTSASGMASAQATSGIQAPLGISASVGSTTSSEIQAPAALSTSPLATMPAGGDDNGEDQGEDNLGDVSIGDDDSGDSLAVGVSVAASSSDEVVGQQDGSDDSGSDD